MPVPEKKHPWEALGLGIKPFRVSRRIYDERLADKCRVILGLCDVCGGATEESWLISSTDNQCFIACPACIEARGSRLLLRQMDADRKTREGTRREFERLEALRRNDERIESGNQYR